MPRAQHLGPTPSFRPRSPLSVRKAGTVADPCAVHACVNERMVTLAPPPAGDCLMESGDRYSGGWRGGLRHGEGSCLFVNGDKYRGHWAGGVRCGQGSCQFANGDMYEGGLPPPPPPPILLPPLTFGTRACTTPAHQWKGTRLPMGVMHAYIQNMDYFCIRRRFCKVLAY